jgi:hypothetical protein
MGGGDGERWGWEVVKPLKWLERHQCWCEMQALAALSDITQRTCHWARSLAAFSTISTQRTCHWAKVTISTRMQLSLNVPTRCVPAQHCAQCESVSKSFTQGGHMGMLMTQWGCSASEMVAHTASRDARVTCEVSLQSVCLQGCAVWTACWHAGHLESRCLHCIRYPLTHAETPQNSDRISICWLR